MSEQNGNGQKYVTNQVLQLELKSMRNEIRVWMLLMVIAVGGLNAPDIARSVPTAVSSALSGIF